MKRRQLVAAAAGVALLLGWALYKSGWFSTASETSMPQLPSRVRTGAAMDTSSGWRYRQNQPHHWRYIMLRN